jgi:hypothetical protein
MFKSMCVIIIDIRCKDWKSKDIKKFVLELLLVVLVGYAVIFTNAKIVLEIKCKDWENKDGLSTKFCNLKTELLKIESVLQFLRLKYYQKKQVDNFLIIATIYYLHREFWPKISHNHYYLHTLAKLNMHWFKNRTKAKSKQKFIIVLISKFLLYLSYILEIFYCNNNSFFLIFFMIILMEED